MRSKVFALTVMVVLAGGWSSCKDDPVTPKPPPVVNRMDTIHHALSVNPDSTATILIHSSPALKVTAEPPLPKPYTLLWTIDTQTLSRMSVDTLSYKLDAGLRHTIKAVYIDSTGSRRDSIASIILVKDTTVLPGDTSSHDFVWREFTSVGGENNMTGCCVFGPNDIWTINGDLHHFDGHSWTTIILHDQSGKSLQGAFSGCSIFGFSDNDLWFTHAGESAHYIGNGTVVGYKTWQTVLAWTYSCWGTSSNNLYVVGDTGVILHFDGKNWTKMSTPTTKRLTSISGTSSSSIWAVGYNPDNGESEVLHYDGVNWSKDQLSLSGEAQKYGIGDVIVADSSGHPTVAIAGDVIYRKTDNSPWRLDVTVPNGNNIGFGVRANGANDLLIAGGWGLVAHWSGNTWKRYDQFYAPGALGYGAEGISIKGNTACVVGVKNGTSWVLIGQRK